MALELLASPVMTLSCRETDTAMTEAAAPLTAWARQHLTAPADIDCTIAVMLKMLDGKCKMGAEEKIIMADLYRGLTDASGQHLGTAEHALIARAGAGTDESLVMEIYERRLLAETMISRPVMKAYKARLRAAGILPTRTATEE